MVDALLMSWFGSKWLTLGCKYPVCFNGYDFNMLTVYFIHSKVYISATKTFVRTAWEAFVHLLNPGQIVLAERGRDRLTIVFWYEMMVKTLLGFFFFIKQAGAIIICMKSND